jgi:signal transduction histidine kinase
MVGLTAAGFPAQYEQLTTPCQTTSCANEQLPREAVQAFEAHGLSLTSYAVYDIAREVVFVTVWLAVAALIFWRRSSDRGALVVSFFLVTFGVGTFTDTLNALADAQPMFTSLVRSVEVLGVSFLAVALLLFPDGRFVPRWTGFLAVAFILLQIVGLLFPSSPLGQIDNELFVLLFGTLFGTIVLAQAYRYRRISGPVERQQTKWAVSGIVAALVGFFGLIGLTAIFPALARPGSLASILTESAFPGIMLLIPLSFGMAILRSRLWDIDVLINRALVYTALTTIIVGLYVLVVGALGTLLQARGNLFISLLGAGLVAVLFQPLRERLQRIVNHRMYGERDDPYAVLSRLGERLEATLDPEAVLSAIVETVREALRLPYATIVLEVDGGPEVAASSGEAVEKPQRLPLTYQNEHVGKLLLAPRAGEEDFSEADRRLLEDLSRQAGIAAHAVRLTADLQRARERLVSAREEERRRLRRDLHDGLGPQLSSQTLTIDAVRSLMRRDPDAAEDLLVDLKGQAQDAISDIRRLVYSLRPPALDDLGLLGALRESAAQYGHNGLDVRVEAPEELTSLPAAVEVAAYRIAQESVTNVARHAHAGSCIVSLAVDEAAKALCLEVRDDGRGMPENRSPGVGLASMRERAAELGGRMIVEALPEGGTIVRARVPLPEEASDFEQQTTEKRSES